MTGMDVLRRIRAYEKDMQRLRLRRLCAQDAATQCTRSADMTGHGGGGDRMSEYMARIDAIEREMVEREAQLALDLELAAKLVSAIDPAQGAVLHMRMVRGMTVRETAASLHTSCDSVRGLYRRGCGALEGVDV